MMLLSKRKMIYVTVLAAMMFLGTFASVFADSSDEDMDTTGGKIIMVEIPDGKGGMTRYTGKDAERVYEEFEKEDQIQEEKLRRDVQRYADRHSQDPQIQKKTQFIFDNFDQFFHGELQVSW